MLFSRLGRRLVRAGHVAAGLVAAAALLASSPASSTPADVEEGTLALPMTGEVLLDEAGVSLPLPAGSRLAGSLNPDFTVDGALEVPQVAVPVRLPEVPRSGPGSAQVRLVGTAPTETTYDADGGITVTHRFRLELPELTLEADPATGIVEETCRSGEVTATLTGDSFDLFEPFTLEGDFAVPAFRGCGASLFGLPSLRDLLLTELFSGPDNHLRLQVGPLG